MFNIVADRGPVGSEMYGKRGLVYAILDNKVNRVGVPIKASALPGKPTLSKIEAKFLRNQERRAQFKMPLKFNIEMVLKELQSASKGAFIANMQKKHVSVLFRKNEEGRVFGVTYVDHKNHTVFNGSDLGKAYSATGLLERISSTSQLKNNLLQIKVTPEESASVTPQHEKTGSINSGRQDFDLMGILMQKASFEPMENIKRNKKRKRKKKSKSINKDLGHNL